MFSLCGHVTAKSNELFFLMPTLKRRGRDLAAWKHICKWTYRSIDAAEHDLIDTKMSVVKHQLSCRQLWH